MIFWRASGMGLGKSFGCDDASNMLSSVLYGITSLTPRQADASQLLELARGHWAIENHLHYRRDVTLGEDACQVRKGSAPHVLAVLNSFVLGLLDFWHVTNAKQFLRLLDAQPLRAVRLLFTSLAEH